MPPLRFQMKVFERRQEFCFLSFVFLWKLMSWCLLKENSQGHRLKVEGILLLWKMSLEKILLKFWNWRRIFVLVIPLLNKFSKEKIQNSLIQELKTRTIVHKLSLRKNLDFLTIPLLLLNGIWKDFLMQNRIPDQNSKTPHFQALRNLWMKQSIKKRHFQQKKKIHSRA